MLGMAPTGLWCAASLVQVLCEAPACLVWPPAACKDGPAADCWGTLARCALWLCPFLTGGCAPWPAQVKEYYGEYNTLERGEGAVMRESKKVQGWGRCFHPGLRMCGRPGGQFLLPGHLQQTALQGKHADMQADGQSPLLLPGCRTQVADLVDKFYSLVTDLYEWGWGQSFHFSRKLPNRDWTASEVAHEAWAAATIRLG